MATPFAQEQMVRSGGVSYMPRPMMTPVTRSVRPTRRTNAKREEQQGPVGILGALAAQAANTPTALARQQQVAQEAAEAARPLWQKGLGAVVGNPIVGAALKGVEYLSVPRRAVQMGISEFATALPEWAENTPATAALKWVDEGKVRNDERSVWERLNDPDYGWGQIAKSTGNQWLDRGVGFAGDIAYDPMTYVTGGAQKIAEVPRVARLGAEASKATEVLAQASKLSDEALEAGLGSLGRIDDVTELTRIADEANATYKAARAAPGATRRVTAHANRAGRLNELYTLGARQSPEWMERNLDELARIAQRGYGAAVTPEVREALNLADPTLRFMGQAIPVSKLPAQLVQRGGGMVRGGLNRSGLGTKLARGGMGLEGVVEDLVGRGSGRGDTYRALATGYGHNLSREGREVEARVNQILGGFRRSDLKGRTTEQIERLVTSAETPGTMDPLNNLFEQISKVYEDVSGRSIEPYLRDKSSYFPHMFTPEARAFMISHENGAQSARDAMGFVVDDLMEGSRFLEKSRKFAPAEGKPTKFLINGREVTLTTGTVEEANEQLVKAFPELGKDFKFFETNPERVVEAYGSSLARGAGRDIASRKLAESEYPFVQTLTGDILGEKEAFERQLAAQHGVADTMLRGYSPQAAQDVVTGSTKAARAAAQTPVPNSEHFMATKGTDATKAMTAALKGPQAKAFVAQAKAASSKGMSDLINMVRTERQPLLDELTGQAEAYATAAEKAASRRVATRKLSDNAKRLERVLTDSKNLLAADQESLTHWVSDVRGEIADLKEQLARNNRNVGRRLTKAEKATRTTLREQIETYERVASKLESQINTRYAPLGREAEARAKHLNQEVERARTEMGRVETEFDVARPHSNDEVAAAHNVRENTGYEPRLSEAQRQERLELSRERDELSGFIMRGANSPKSDKSSAQAVLDRLAAHEAAAAEAAPTGPLSWKRGTDGAYSAPGGWKIEKNGKRGFLVTAPDGTQEATKTLGQAKELADQYAQLMPEGTAAAAAAAAAEAVPPPVATFESIGDNVLAADTPAGRYRIEPIDLGDGEPLWMVEYPNGEFIDEPLGTVDEAMSHVQAHLEATAAASPTAAPVLSGPSMAGAVGAAFPAAIPPPPSAGDVSWARRILGREDVTPQRLSAAKARQAKVEARLQAIAEETAVAPPMTKAEAQKVIKAHEQWLAKKEEALGPARRRLELAEREKAVTQASIVENRHGERLWHPEIGTEQAERVVQPLPYGEQPPAAAFAEEPVEGAVPFAPTPGRVNREQPLGKYPLRKPPSEEEAIREVRRSVVDEWKDTARRARVARERKVGLIENAPEIIERGKQPTIDQYVEQVVGHPTDVTIAGQREGGFTGLEGQIQTKEATLSRGIEQRSGAIRNARDEVTSLTRSSQEAAQKLINTKDANAVAKTEASQLRAQSRKVEGQIKSGSHNGKKLGDLAEIDRQMISPLEKLIGSAEQGITGSANDLSDPVIAHTAALLDEAAKMSLDTGIAQLSGKQAQKMIDAAANGTLAPVMIATLNDNWKLLYDGIPKTGDIIMDKQLAKRFENLYQLDKQPQVFGRTFNAMTNLFKTYATLSPGFQVRNSLGGIFMNTSDGVALKHQHNAIGLWRRFMNEGEGFLTDPSIEQEVRDAFRATFSSGAGGRYNEAGVVGGRPPFKTGAGAYQAAMNNRATRLGQRVGAKVEGVLRLGMALDSIYEGQTVQEALTRINRVHFDYADVSKMDKNMKAFVPFWTFMSRNLPLQISQTWTKPRAYQIYESFVRNFSSADEPNTPEYWTDQGGWNSGLKLGGLPMYMLPDLGYQQMEGQAQTLEEALSGEPLKLLSMGNPLMTAAPEYVTRQDFFTGQQFPENEGFTKASGPLGGLYTGIAALTGNTNPAGEIDPRFTNAMRAINPVLDRTMRLAPQALAAESGQGTGSRQLESWLRWFGAPIRTLTPEAQRNAAYAKHFDKVDAEKRRRQMAS